MLSLKLNTRCLIIVRELKINSKTHFKANKLNIKSFEVSQNSLYVTTKLAQVTVERENGCLGLTLRGGSDLPIIVTNVRVNGPVYKTGRIKPGDRVLRVDNVRSFAY